MRLRKILGIGAIVAAASLAGAPGASASILVGSDCGATGTVPNTTVVPLATTPFNPFPIAVPNAGVATSWIPRVGAPTAGIPQALKVLRPTGAPNEFRTIAESGVEVVLSAPRSFPIRISVQPGDRFGLYGGAGTLLCSPLPGNSAGKFSGDLLTGSAATFSEEPNGQVPVAVIVEPDSDGDGYGDETQDKCPQSAAIQVVCPPVSIGAYGIVNPNSVLILASVSSQAPVTVFGSVKLPKRGKGSKPRTSAPVTIPGGTKTLAPNEISRFTLRLPESVRSKLEGMPSKRALELVATVTATDVTGQTNSRTLGLKLRGRKAAPRPPRH